MASVSGEALVDSNPSTNWVKVSIEQAAVKAGGQKELFQIAAYFNKTKFFRELTENHDYEVYKKMKVRSIEEGVDLFRYGDKAEYFYFIMKGEVDVWIPSNLDLKNLEDKEYSEIKLKKVNVIRQGGTFGELAFITQKTRAATIRASEDTIIAECDKKTYLRCIKKKEIKKLEKRITLFNCQRDRAGLRRPQPRAAATPIGVRSRLRGPGRCACPAAGEPCDA